MALREYAGNAPATRLLGSLAAGSTASFTVVTGGGAGYPTGSLASFVVVIDRGTAKEEKILVNARSGDIFGTGGAGLTRGYDNTTDQDHSAQAIVEHPWDAASATEVNAHVNDDVRDDHSQYLNTSRHALVEHPSSMITDLSITEADIADTSITYSKLEIGQRWEPGDMKMTFASTPTAGWLICDGSLVSTTTYDDLFAVIGHSANGGSNPGGGNFKLPDLQQRFPMGKAASGTGSTLGGTGGTKDAVAVSHGHSNSLSVDGSNEPAHVHGTGDGGAVAHSINGAAGGDMAIRFPAALNGIVAAGTEKITFTNMNDHPNHNHGNTGSGGSHDHTYTVGGSVTAAGVSGTDANLPGYQVVNYMIKT